VLSIIRIIYFWRMKRQRIQFYLYITFSLIVIIFSCQKKRNTKNELNEAKREIEKVIEVADQFYKTEKHDSAFYYYNAAKLIADPKIDAEKIAFSLLKMSEIQQKNGDYIGSGVTATEAIPYITKANNLDYTWTIYRIIGVNYFSIYDFENSIVYYQKAYQLKTDMKRKIAIQNNIALVYREQKKYTKAISIYEAVIEGEVIKKFPEDYALILDNLGYCYYAIKDPRALSCLTEAQKIKSKIKDNIGLATNYYNLGIFHQQDNFALAKKYMLLSYEKFTFTKSPTNRMTSLALLIKNSKGSELKKYSVIYVDLVDSIFEVRQKAKNQFARIKYDSKKEKDENLKLKTQRAENELQLEKQKNRNIISYIIIALSLSLILVLYFYLTSKGNKEKIEATYKSETRIAKKLHDELANDIYHTMAFAENKNLSIAENKEQLLKNLDVIYSRTRDISTENNPIITDEKYVFHLKEMIAGFNTQNINLILNEIEIIDWNEIDRNKKIAVYRVLQELLVNMKKHSNASLVGITFKNTNKDIIVNYTDNGKGIDVHNMSFKNGLYNVENRILRIKGTIHIDSAPGKGFKVYFKFPI